MGIFVCRERLTYQACSCQRAMFPVCLARLTERCSSWPTKSSRETTTNTRKILQMQSWWVINPTGHKLSGNMLSVLIKVRHKACKLSCLIRPSPQWITSSWISDSSVFPPTLFCSVLFSLHLFICVNRVHGNISQWRHYPKYLLWPQHTRIRWCELACKTSTIHTMELLMSSHGHGGTISNYSLNLAVK